MAEAAIVAAVRVLHDVNLASGPKNAALSAQKCC